MFKTIIITVFIIYICVILRDIISLYILNIWLEKYNKKTQKTPSINKLIHIIIPIENENTNFNSLYSYYRQLTTNKPNVHIVFSTSENYVHLLSKKSYEQLFKEIQEHEPSSNIHIYTLTQKNASKSCQINYVIRELKKSFIDQRLWFGIYSTNSRLNNKTLDYIQSQISDDSNENTCLQQYNYYCINSSSKIRSVISSAALWQNRTILISKLFGNLYIEHLYKLLNKQYLKPLRPILSIALGKVNNINIDGLFINSNTFEKIGDFPENIVDTNTYFSFLINNRKVQVRPIPYLDEVEITTDIDIYFRQQNIKFYEVWHAFKYQYFLKSKSNDISQNKKSLDSFEIYCIYIKSIIYSAIGLISPIILLFILPLFMTIYFGIVGIVLNIAIIMFYLPVIHLLARDILKSNFRFTDSNGLPDASAVYCILLYALQCFSYIKHISNNQEKQSGSGEENVTTDETFNI